MRIKLGGLTCGRPWPELGLLYDWEALVDTHDDNDSETQHSPLARSRELRNAILGRNALFTRQLWGLGESELV